MRSFLLFSGLLLLISVNVFAQTSSPTPAVPAPTPFKPPRAPIPLSQQGGFNSASQGPVPDRLALRLLILQMSVQPLYRKPTKEELKALAPDSGLKQKFAEFLKQENTGLIKFPLDYGCAGNTKVITATENCLKFTMPGAGNSYSFRTDSYRIRHLADLTFTGKSFNVTGILSHGIMVNLGDLPLENITLQTAGTKFLNEFQPTVDVDKAVEFERLLSAGINKDGFLYSRALSVLENTTYVLRSIAYNGKFFRSVRGITYNEIDFDKRKDITVAFRVVRRDDDGSVTILWKELLKKDAPKIKRKQTEQNKQIKENKLVAKNLAK